MSNSSLEDGHRMPASTVGESGKEIQISEQQRKGALAGANGPPPFKLSSLWRAPVLNPINAKSYTLPIFNLNNPYARNFHLSWLGFFVAFFSWFAFPPLIPEAIKTDLKLTTAQISNSNIIALAATLLVRFIAGPLIDRYGPRYVMAAILVLGAIPSGLAGTVTTPGGLYAIRFFIGILGGTFVPCQAWTTAFFDKSIVGRANALVGGWGNAGGGVVFLSQTGLFRRLVDDGVSPHNAWRACFAILPVPLCLGTAALTLLFGTDHPAGKWSQRHNLPATAIAVMHGHKTHLDHDEKARQQQKLDEKSNGKTTVLAVPDNEDLSALDAQVKSEVDTAVNEPLTFATAIKILSRPITWLPALSYMTSFGLELAVDANLANTLFALYQKTPHPLTQLRAGYFTSLFGLLNIFTRPLGGYLGDVVYRKGGVPAKKWLTLVLATSQGLVMIGLGVYIEHHGARSGLATIMGLITLIAFFCEFANGACFSMVPHINPYSNGFMSGIVGSFGNLGGIWFALIFRFLPLPQGKAYWVMGIVCVAANAIVSWIPVPKW